MKLAIMQPYFIPYAGYWQLINSVDRFVIYDDVNFIKNGWINRNRILINGEPKYMTIPLQGASPFKNICELSVDPSFRWRKKILRSIELSYRNSRFFDQVYPEIKRIIHYETNDLSTFLIQQISAFSELLGLQTEIIRSSDVYENSHLSGQERILDICRQENADEYINLSGGKKLYDSASFNEKGIALRFLTCQASPYKQQSAEHVPSLSIIDMLMEIGVKATATSSLIEYELE